MSRYLIERRFGACNRDWLSALSDTSCVWSGVSEALPFASKRIASRALATLRRQALRWPQAYDFIFVLIHDRRHLPDYTASVEVGPRHRCGSWDHFERKFRPVIRDDGTLIWHNEEIPRPITGRHWWTVLDCDGKLYVAAGFRYVNRIGYIRTEVAWTKADECRDWRYD